MLPPREPLAEVRAGLERILARTGLSALHTASIFGNNFTRALFGLNDLDNVDIVDIVDMWT
jgi:hypothetical protein